MAMVVRVAYNNKGWKAPCDNPGKDDLCWHCFEGILQIKPPKKDDITCSGECWERRLRTEYRWGCTPKGRVYGSDAYKGVKVFLVFKQRDGNYTIWGRTQVNSIDDKPIQSSNESENGYAFLHFEKFEPLPRDKWVTGLSDVELVGARWLQGRHRYIGTELATKLDYLIERKELPPAAMNYTLNADELTISVQLAQNVLVRLNKAAREEGRTKDEIMREAIAEWLRTRGI